MEGERRIGNGLFKSKKNGEGVIEAVDEVTNIAFCVFT